MKQGCYLTWSFKSYKEDRVQEKLGEFCGKLKLTHIPHVYTIEKDTDGEFLPQHILWGHISL